jgi:hypothetical protein
MEPEKEKIILTEIFLANNKMFAMSTTKKVILILLSVFALFIIIGFITKITSFFLTGLLIFIVGWVIYNQLHEHYTQDDPKLNDLKNRLELFFKNKKNWKYPLKILNEKDIMKNIKLYRGEKSYTINKEKVYICLKDENANYYDDNTLIYVIAHELSHAICDEIGHTEKFHLIFDALLEKMEEEGLYNSKFPIKNDYCNNGDSEIST